MSRMGRVVGLFATLAMSGCQAQSGAPDLSSPSLTAHHSHPTNSTVWGARTSTPAITVWRRRLSRRDGTEPRQIICLDWFAAAYDNLKRFDLADQAYEQAKRLKGETLPILNNIGYSYYLRGDRRRALAQLEHALALYPSNPVILNNIVWSVWGSCRTVAHRPEPSPGSFDRGPRDRSGQLPLSEDRSGRRRPDDQAGNGLASIAGSPGQTTSDLRQMQWMKRPVARRRAAVRCLEREPSP